MAQKTNKASLAQRNAQNQPILLDPSILGWGYHQAKNGSHIEYVKLHENLGFETFHNCIANFTLFAHSARYLADIIRAESEKERNSCGREVLFVGSVCVYRYHNIIEDFYGDALECNGSIWFGIPEEEFRRNNGKTLMKRIQGDPLGSSKEAYDTALANMTWILEEQKRNKGHFIDKGLLAYKP